MFTPTHLEYGFVPIEVPGLEEDVGVLWHSLGIEWQGSDSTGK
jgi:hypothetical protein